MDILINIGKFLLGAILKVAVIVFAVLLIWLGICIFLENSFIKGLAYFLTSEVTCFIGGWFIASWGFILSGDIQKTIMGILMFFAPVIILAISTPNPDIELYDSSGNLWKLRKG